MQAVNSEPRVSGTVAVVVGVVALAAALTSCGPTESDRDEPERLTVGVLPDASESVLRQIHRPLIDYLGTATGLETELFVPASYDELLRSFENREVHLAWFGGLSFLRAENSAHADPLVMRDVDLEFTTDFLVAASAPGVSVEDFAGKIVSFGPRLSTSGHLMPRYFLRLRGTEPEDFFAAIRHSAGHDQTAGWVRDGEVDVGAVNSVYVESMFADGRLTLDQVRVLWTTPPYRNYVWAVQPDLAAGLRQRLLDAFLALEAAVPEHAAILAPYGAGGFVPASRADYADLRLAAELVAESLSAEVSD